MNDDYEDLLNLDKELDSRLNKILTNEKNIIYKSSLATKPKFPNPGPKSLSSAQRQPTRLKADLAADPSGKNESEGKNGHENKFFDENKIYLDASPAEVNSHQYVENSKPNSNEIQHSENSDHETGPSKPIEKISSDEELSLDEFLSSAAELKIKTIEKRCNTLIETLKKAQEKMKFMSIELTEAEKTAKESTREAASAKKALSSKELLLKKREGDHTRLTHELTAQKQLYQELSKEHRAVAKKCESEARRAASQQKEGERLKERLRQKGGEGERMAGARKEEEARLRSKLSASEASCGALRRTVFGLWDLVRRQEDLVGLLQEQKPFCPHACRPNPLVALVQFCGFSMRRLTSSLVLPELTKIGVSFSLQRNLAAAKSAVGTLGPDHPPVHICTLQERQNL